MGLFDTFRSLVVRIFFTYDEIVTCGVRSAPQVMDINDFKSFLTTGKSLAEASIVRTVCLVNVFIKWLENNNKEFNKSSVEGFLYQLSKNKSSNTLNAYRSSLVTYEEYLNDRGQNFHFMEKFKSYSTERTKPIEILSVEEIKHLLDTRLNYSINNGYDLVFVEDTNQMLLKFLVYTGSRVGGAIALRTGDVDWDSGKARFKTKGNRIHEVFLLEPLLSELKTYSVQYKKQAKDLLFCTSTGGKIQKGTFNKYLIALGKKAEITKHIHSHLLRHCFTSLMKANGADIADISKLLGHKNISTTFVNYLQYFDTTLKKVLEKYHPLLREGLSPHEKLQLLAVVIREFGIIDDERFITRLEEMGNMLKFETAIK